MGVIHLERLYVLEVVSVPAFDGPVFTSREEHVRVGNEPHGHDTIVMGKDRLVTITKIQAPYTNILIHRTAH